MTLLVAAVVDLSIILAVGLGATLLMRRRSAAMRHWILAAAVIAAAIAPALELILPPWPVPLAAAFGFAPSEVTSTLRFTTAAAPLAAIAESTPAPAAGPLPWTAIAIVAWMAGALVGLIGLVTGLVRLVRLTARCEPVLVGPWRETADRLSADLRLPHVQILQSDNPSLLVTWGLVTPKIILPAGAAEWSEPRRRIVLAHEMAHIGRRDWLVHMSAEALRAFYWVNPLAWAACRRLRQESEYACDDAVLSGGVDATEYASHLLAVARQAIGGRGAWVSAPAIAHPSTLERRISAMLIEKRNREPLTRRACIAAVAAIVAVALPITALAVSRAADVTVVTADVVLTPQVIRGSAPLRATVPARPVSATPRNRAVVAAVQQAAATISVVVRDPSGGVLPGVDVTLTEAQSGMRYRQVTDGSGRLAIGQVQPGRYDMVMALPGFATAKNELEVAPGQNVQRTVTLRLGSLEETVTVGCAAPAASIVPDDRDVVVDTQRGVAYVNGERYTRGDAAAVVAMAARLRIPAFAQDRPAGTPVRVGGQISSPSPLRRVNPVCPNVPFAGNALVVLEGTINTNGSITALRQLPPAASEPVAPPEFVESAVAAVSQWTFTPTRLNNVPVAVIITVRVAFQR
jgi:beta-lactamase regulating signal transducer with metallopeptidase domain